MVGGRAPKSPQGQRSSGLNRVGALVGIVGGVAIVAAAIFFSGWTQGIRSGGYDHAGPAMTGPGGTMGPGREDGTRSAATQRLCRRFGGHGVDHAAEPASSRPSRPDKSGRYSRLAVRYDAGPAANAHLGQSHPNAGPLWRPRLRGGGAGRLGRGTGPRPAHTEERAGLSRLDSQGPVDDRPRLRHTEGTTLPSRSPIAASPPGCTANPDSPIRTSRSAPTPGFPS